MAKLIMFRTVLPRTLIAFCLLGLVTTCNSTVGNNAPTSPTVPPSASITPGTNLPSAQSSSPPPLNIGKTIVFDLAGLLHIEFNPITCSPEGHTNVVVLASNRLEYDSGEIQQMNTYLGQISPPAPPATLIETSGAFVGEPTASAQAGCSVNLQVTNIGNSAIQITGVDVRLQSDAQLNQYQYRLIDLCSVNRNVCSIRPPHHLGVTFPYYFNLSMAKANTVFSGQLQGNQPLLDPGQVAFIRLYFSSSENLIYSVAPEITVSLVNQQTTYTLSQLTSTLAFANPGQFSCYQLQSNGNTFAQIGLSVPGTLCS